MKKKRIKASVKNSERKNEEYISFDLGNRGGYSDYFAGQFNENAGITRTEIRKKQNKKRRMKNGMRNTLITLGVIAFVAVLSVVFSLTIFFNITTIKISGSGIYEPEEIAKACTIKTGDNLFMIDKERCAESIKSSYPYIDSVSIKRKLPATLEITVTDAKVFFAVADSDKKYILLDNKLKVLEKGAAKKPKDAILIKDAKPKTANEGFTLEFNDETVSQCIAKLADEINTMQISGITAIGCKNKNNNYIVYDGRITFELGSSDGLEKKINRGLAICEELDSHNNSIKGKSNLTVDKQSYFTEE